ncbi:MAG: hypothetical protein KAI83_18000 [Thiomargarita sp.]|nr:hypothetical protein [Thiomargarita sp.]
MPLHQNISVSLHKNIVVGAILYGCPDSLLNIELYRSFHLATHAIAITNQGIMSNICHRLHFNRLTCQENSTTRIAG